MAGGVADLFSSRVHVLPIGYLYAVDVRYVTPQTLGGWWRARGSPVVRRMLDDEELQRVYQWVDEIPLSRPKRSIARDFADGVLVAEIVCHYFPKMIELHNYSNANGYAQKIYNWCVRHREGVCEPRAPVISGSTHRLSPLPQEHAQPEGLQEARLPAAEGGDGRAVQLPDAGGRETTEDAADEDGQVRPRTHGPWLRRRRMPARTHASPSPLPPRYGAKRAATSDAQSDQGSQHSKATPRSVAAPTRRSAAGGPSPAAATDGAVRELLAEKDLNINELRETVDILEIKIQKLEQLVRLKDSKIATLQAKLQQQPM